MTRLERSFFARPPQEVAADLIGKILTHHLPDGSRRSGRIVEVEAYLAHGDGAAHNKHGRTEARKSLFADAGTLYIHPMRQYVGMDIVTEGVDIPSSVLIRSLEPLEDIDEMMQIMACPDATRLANGPGKLCKAMGITRQMDGHDITQPQSTVYVTDDGQRCKIENTQRIGISQAKEMTLRFHHSQSRYVSK